MSTSRASLAAVPDAVLQTVLSWLDFADHCRFAACQHRLDVLARHPVASSPTMTLHVGETLHTHVATCRLRATPTALVVHVAEDTKHFSFGALRKIAPSLLRLRVVAPPSVRLDYGPHDWYPLRHLVALDVSDAHLVDEDEVTNGYSRYKEVVVRGRNRYGLGPKISGRLAGAITAFDAHLGAAPLANLLWCTKLVSLGYMVNGEAAHNTPYLSSVLTHLPVLQHLVLRKAHFCAVGTQVRALTLSPRSAHLCSLTLIDCTLLADVSPESSPMRQIGAHMHALERLEISYDTPWLLFSNSYGLVRAEDATPLCGLSHLVSLRIRTAPVRDLATRDEVHYGFGAFPVLQDLALSADYPLTGLVAPHLRCFNGHALAPDELAAHRLPPPPPSAAE